MIARQPAPGLRLSITHDCREPQRPQQAGGDIVAVSEHRDGSIAFLVADVAAKGREGEGFAVWLATLFCYVARFEHRPARILEYLNWRMYDAFADPVRGLFATAFVCRCFPEQEFCVYSSAGAEPAIVFNEARSPRQLCGDGIVLGVDRCARYRDRSCNVAADEALIVFTDGVTESPRVPPLGRLGTKGLLEAVLRANRETGIPTCHDVLDAVERLNGGTYHDDATLLLARFSPVV